MRNSLLPHEQDYDPRAPTFAKHLKSGIQNIKRVEKIRISDIEKQLGSLLGYKGGSTIQYWCKEGSNPPSLPDVRLLGKEIMQRGGLDIAWYQQLLALAGHSPTDEFEHILKPVPFAPVSDTSFLHNRQKLLIEAPSRWQATGPQRAASASQIELFLHPFITTASDSASVHNAVNNVWSSTEISMLFQHQHRILILGASGSGKTTLLFDLIESLQQQFKHDAHQPIPLLFNLGTWAANSGDFEAWLVSELHNKYQIPKLYAERWLKQQALLLMLDGLDEVKMEEQSACVETMNAYLTNAQAALVVTCRTNDYLAMSMQLQIDSALEVQPLTIEQADQFLSAVGSEATAIRQSLRENVLMRELGANPFTLNMLVATQNAAKGDPEWRNTNLAEVNRQLLSNYIDGQLQLSTPIGQEAINREKRWLAWLASRMLEQSTIPFMLEALQPTWLKGKLEKMGYGTVTALIGMLVFGLVIGLVYRGEFARLGALLGALLFFLRSSLELNTIKPAERVRWSWSAASNGAKGGLIFGTLAGLSGALGFWLIFGLIGGQSLSLFSKKLFRQKDERQGSNDYEMLVGLICGVVGTAVGGVHAIPIGGLVALVIDGLIRRRPLQYDWARRSSAITTAFLGGLLVWRNQSLVAGMNDIWIPGISRGLIRGFPFGFGENWVGGIIGALLSGLVVALIGGWILGWIYSEEIEMRNRPNQGIELSWMNSLWIGCFTAGFAYLTFEALHLIVDGLLRGWHASIVFGLMAGMSYGGFAFLLHYGLRTIMWLNGHIPWRYVAFLDHAAKQMLLRKVGCGYIFLHRLLQEHIISEFVG